MIIIEDSVVMMHPIPPSHELDHRRGSLALDRRSGMVCSLPPIKKVLNGDRWPRYGLDPRWKFMP